MFIPYHPYLNPFPLYLVHRRLRFHLGTYRLGRHWRDLPACHPRKGYVFGHCLQLALELCHRIRHPLLGRSLVLWSQRNEDRPLGCQGVLRLGIYLCRLPRLHLLLYSVRSAFLAFSLCIHADLIISSHTVRPRDFLWSRLISSTENLLSSAPTLTDEGSWLPRSCFFIHSAHR